MLPLAVICLANYDQVRRLSGTGAPYLQLHLFRRVAKQAKVTSQGLQLQIPQHCYLLALCTLTNTATDGQIHAPA